MISPSDHEDYGQDYLDNVVRRGGGDGEVAESDFSDGDFDPAPLFRPLKVGSALLPNRLVMAPMTRNMSAGGVPNDAVVEYYRRRAEGGIGLIVTEGTYVPHAAAGFSTTVPRFHGEDALAGWKRVVDAVHDAGSRIFPQLWHVGLMPLPGDELDPMKATSPSGYLHHGEKIGRPASEADLEQVAAAFGEAAASARAIGCDGIQIHGAHGYLVDQFFWDGTNLREDGYGGETLLTRSRLGLEIVRECRRRTAPDFPIMFRFSQWKQQDFTARLVQTPQELERFLTPLADAGVDIFDCSTRRFWVAEFDGSDMNLAGWTKKLTGKTTSTVGSVTLDKDLFDSFAQKTDYANNLKRLIAMMERGDFDLVNVGRALIADAQWGNKVREGRQAELNPYSPALLGTLE
jgi:2,4-dienoyl-CoA reductase-like NADH-dependent reductase (Old Yellow Enzyme family)